MPYKDPKSSAAKASQKRRRKRWEEQHPEHHASIVRASNRSEYHKEYHRLAKYGLTKEACLDILIKQDFKCACCREPLTIDDRFTIDHDHQCCDSIKTCGKCVRGILCMNCNAGLGNFKDSLDLLLLAVEYIRRSDGFCRK